MVNNQDDILHPQGINPHLPSGTAHPYQLDESISNLGVSGVLFFYSISNRYSCLQTVQILIRRRSGSTLFAYVRNKGTPA